MKADLKKIFNLPACASDADILAAAQRGAQALAENESAAEEKETVAALIRDSCGGLTEKSARTVMRNRALLSLPKPKHS